MRRHNRKKSKDAGKIAAVSLVEEKEKEKDLTEKGKDASKR